ncbi:MAG TPA: hypothetical protein EYP40_11245 [Chromatiales bacterium]|nr:hypothetical protein [Chromatiales bacterium]
MSEKDVFEFPGEKISVRWDGRLCIHVAECGQAQGELFVGGRKPWCLPDRVDPAEVVAVVERCPSGALCYQAHEEGVEERPVTENTVSVTCNGPYFLAGELDIEGAAEDMPGVRYRAALCRCGKSGNKPFCDNSHEAAGFQDYGAVGETGEDPGEVGGKLEIKLIPDGPLILSGNLTILAGSGRKAWQGNHVALCRCGASNHKPFCDGSHTAAGFNSN